MGIKAAIVAAQQPVRTQPRAEPSDALDAFGPTTSRSVARVDIRGQFLSASLRWNRPRSNAKAQRRKGAGHKTESRSPPNKMLSEMSGFDVCGAKQRNLLRCLRFSPNVFRNGITRWCLAHVPYGTSRGKAGKCCLNRPTAWADFMFRTEHRIGTANGLCDPTPIGNLQETVVCSAGQRTRSHFPDRPGCFDLIGFSTKAKSTGSPGSRGNSAGRLIEMTRRMPGTMTGCTATGGTRALVTDWT